MSGGCHSIQKELEALRPFADRVVSGCYPLYSGEEIERATGQGFKPCKP